MMGLARLHTIQRKIEFVNEYQIIFNDKITRLKLRPNENISQNKDGYINIFGKFVKIVTVTDVGGKGIFTLGGIKR